MRVLQCIVQALSGNGRADVTDLVMAADVQLTPAAQSLVQQFWARLPECDRRMLAAWKAGKTCREIAQDMDTDVETVRHSLARIMSDLRMWLYESGPGPGSDSAPVPLAKTA